MLDVVLDPSEVAIDRTELQIGPWIDQDGIDWGDAEVSQFKAQLRRGEMPSGDEIPNRIVRIPFALFEHGDSENGGTSFETIRRHVQQKVGLIQVERVGWLKRGRTSLGDLFADVVNATLSLPDQWGDSGAEFGGLLTLECLPDFYGPEAELATLPLADYGSELLLTIPDVPGDFPCRTRIVLTSNGTERGAIFALRSRQSTTATTAIPYDPSDLTPLGAASVVGQTVVHENLVDEWQSVLGSDIAGVGPMQHLGPHRIWMVVEGLADNSPIRLRLEWHQGDRTRPNRTEYRSVTVPTGGTFLLDLGEALPKRSPGSQGWGWTLLARTQETAGHLLVVHRVLVTPTGEGYGRMIAADQSSGGEEIVALDSMAGHSPGNLSGKTAPLGGNWSTGGSTGDYSIPDPVDGWVHRATENDSVGGRFGVLTDSPRAGVYVEAEIEHRSIQSIDQGIIARHVDANNRLEVVMRAGFPSTVVHVQKRIGGSFTPVGGLYTFSSPLPDLSQRVLGVAVRPDGTFQVFEGPAGGTLSMIIKGEDSALATGGTLASGGYGLVDLNPLAGQHFRRYRNFAVRKLPAVEDAVLYPDLPGQLRTDGYWRENPSGLLSPLPVLGQHPRLPVSGLEGRAVEVFIRPTSGNLSTTTDELGAQHSATLFSRPSFLTTP